MLLSLNFSSAYYRTATQVCIYTGFYYYYSLRLSNYLLLRVVCRLVYFYCPSNTHTMGLSYDKMIQKYYAKYDISSSLFISNLIYLIVTFIALWRWLNCNEVFSEISPNYVYGLIVDDDINYRAALNEPFSAASAQIRSREVNTVSNYDLSLWLAVFRELKWN